MSTTSSNTGIIGLGVMGRAFAENLLRFNAGLVVYDSSPAAVQDFAGQRPDAIPAKSLQEFVRALQTPRCVIALVPAGQPVDDVIGAVVPLLDDGDILVDLGNSHWQDTDRRARELADTGIVFVGSGISGGEEGARLGPAMMPGGDPAAWSRLGPVLQPASAQVDGDPCCYWIGRGGAGHFVKTVHNGIEYGDMQLLAEAFDLMHRGCRLPFDVIATHFDSWNRGRLQSYLVEITADVLRTCDTDGTPLVARVLDVAGQKGTGTWTGISALELGVPAGLIAEAVFARAASARKSQRTDAEALFASRLEPANPVNPSVVNDIELALEAARIISYTQGFMLLVNASREYGFDLDLASVARGWRGGCIIRSNLLDPIAAAFEKNPDLECLLLDEYFADRISAATPAWRRVVTASIAAGVAVPALSSGLAFFDTMRSGTVPANLIQALRDCFGAHTFERTDQARGEFFHSDWRGQRPPS